MVQATTSAALVQNTGGGQSSGGGQAAVATAAVATAGASTTTTASQGQGGVAALTSAMAAVVSFTTSAASAIGVGGGQGAVTTSSTTGVYVKVTTSAAAAQGGGGGQVAATTTIAAAGTASTPAAGGQGAVIAASTSAAAAAVQTTTSATDAESGGGGQGGGGGQVTVTTTLGGHILVATSSSATAAALRATTSMASAQGGGQAAVTTAAATEAVASTTTSAEAVAATSTSTAAAAVTATTAAGVLTTTASGVQAAAAVTSTSTAAAALRVTTSTASAQGGGGGQVAVTTTVAAASTTTTAGGQGAVRSTSTAAATPVTSSVPAKRRLLHALGAGQSIQKQSNSSAFARQLLGVSSSGLSIGVTVNVASTEAANRVAKVLESKADSIGIPGVPVALSAPVSTAYCGDGVVQGSGDAITRPDGAKYSEVCDDGASNGYGACSNGCQCGSGFALDAQNVSCVCQTDAAIQNAAGYESTHLQGADSTLSFTIFFGKNVAGLSPDGKLAKPVVIIISNLTGALTPSGILPISCSSTSWTTCGLGLAPNNASEPTWRFGSADWSQQDGTLTFIVLRDIHVDSAGREGGTVRLSVTLRNSYSAQSARVPVVQACTGALVAVNADASTGILGAGAIRVDGPAAASRTWSLRKVLGGTESAVASLSATAALPAGFGAVALAIEASRVQQSLTMRLPVGAAFAGILDTGGVSINPVDGSSIRLLNVSFPVRTAASRRAGGCFTPPDNSIDVCLPGFIGVMQWDAAEQLWQKAAGMDISSVGLELVMAVTETAALFSPIVVPPCVNVNGQGRAGGDRVCLSPQQPRPNLYGRASV